MKICTVCKIERNYTDFYFRYDSKKYRNECKICQRSRTSKWARARYPYIRNKLIEKYNENKEAVIKKVTIWAKNNPEKRRKYNVTWRWKLRKEIIIEYGGMCKCCGETIPEFLQIDHINNDGYKMRKEKKESSGGNLYRWLKKNNFPKDRFQLLCSNCNFAKGHFGGCPHND